MALRRVGLSVLLLAAPRLAVCSSAAWSFKDFLEGEWDLEKQRDGVTTRARYLLSPAAPSGEELEGRYLMSPPRHPVLAYVAHPLSPYLTISFFTSRFSELMEFGEEVVVRHDRVVFDDAAHHTGRFHFAKPPPDDDDVEDPREFQHAFDFAFSQVLGGRGWISESPFLLGKGAGRSLQFVVMGPDTFVYSSTDETGVFSTWTAVRRGSVPGGGGGAPKGGQTLWSKYGRTLSLAVAMVGMRAIRAKQ